MASPQAAQLADDNPAVQTTAWASQLAQDFARVALFRVTDAQAELVACRGFVLQRSHCRISLVEQTPLRWSIEAAAPIVGAGRAPGGPSLAAHLGISAPRSYAILPHVVGQRLEMLAYVDQGDAPLNPAALARWLHAEFGTNALPRPNRHAPRRAARRPAAQRQRRQPAAPLALDAPPTAGAAGGPPPVGNHSVATTLAAASSGHGDAASQSAAAAVPRAEALAPTAATAPRPVPPKTPADVLPAWPAVPLFDAPNPAPPREMRQRSRWSLVLLSLMAVWLPAVVVALWAVTPPWVAPREVSVEVPVHARLSAVAHDLMAAGVIRAVKPLLWLTRGLGVDRHMRAGTYTIPTGLWLWQVVDILHRGQVQTLNVTIPEGLTLRETAELWAQHQVVPADQFIAAAHDPQTLRRFGVDGTSAEGFLFPETYKVVRGVSARDVVAAMMRQFYRHLQRHPAAQTLSNEALYDRVILASLVERETRHPAELPRIAGVFANRLERNLRLESCASVQYVLGHPKERLQLEDVRQPSPYNTYLHPGLPPGPIASPGAAAMAAALNPEKHDYLFFFARDDGSHQHHFSRTFEAHQRAHRKLLQLAPAALQ